MPVADLAHITVQNTRRVLPQLHYFKSE